MQFAGINIAGSGQQTIFTNPSTTQFAYVWELYMTCAAATTIQFYDGPGAITGNINVTAGSACHPSRWWPATSVHRESEQCFQYFRRRRNPEEWVRTFQQLN
jgi:hypothetical protein